MRQPKAPMLEIDDIQGDILGGLQKHSQNFVFFKIQDTGAFKAAMNETVIRQITTAAAVRDRQILIERYKARANSEQTAHVDIEVRFTSDGFRQHVIQIARGEARTNNDQLPLLGINVSFTIDGLRALVSDDLSGLDASYVKGAAKQAAILHDPDPSTWNPKFTSDRIDGVFFVTGPNEQFVRSDSYDLLVALGSSIKVVYSEIGNALQGKQRGHEHFGFLDGVSQPGLRGFTPADPENEIQGLPRKDLIWPGEFVFGYNGQDPADAKAMGPIRTMAVPWLRNGSYMVFRRLIQKVPEFHSFVTKQAAALHIYPELLASRMVGRWRSGAPLELAPLADSPTLATDLEQNNNFEYGADPDQRRCPFAAHIRKMYPRDDTGNESEIQTHRIVRAGIPFGPEWEQGETKTVRERGLMFVCYQTDISKQFEFLQIARANNPNFVSDKVRPNDSKASVTPGFDPIIGSAEDDRPREMDEPVPNFPTGDVRSTLIISEQFVVLTAAAYFFVPSLTGLRVICSPKFLRDTALFDIPQ
jgi:Dyp-type peroxidase family